MMVGLSDSATGIELVGAIRAEAWRRGVRAEELARALSPTPRGWLAQAECAARCRPATIARVRALIGGEDVPPPATNNFPSRREAKAFRHRARRAEADPVPPTAPVDRDPCFHCGVRGDIGCAHRVAS